MERSFSFRASSADTTRGNHGPTALLDLAKLRFTNLSAAERKLVEAAADGTDTYCAALLKRDTVIRAELLTWLCINGDSLSLQDNRQHLQKFD